ncbi:MAG: esterase/lipase family protein [Cyanophyceae cyanobacterium]
MSTNLYPTVIVPGYLAGSQDYEPMRQHLESLGYPACVVPLKARDWLPTVGGRSINPILARLDQTIRATLADFGTPKVNLVAHSAGGWISRIYLGSLPYYQQIWAGADRVSALISLGTPHTSQERWTLKNLNFVNDNYPGSHCPGVRYVCVAGRAIQGQRLSWQAWRQGQITGSTWIAYESYKLTCGIGDSWGDGITPIGAAHLVGADNLTLEGVYHSPRQRWYGSVEVIKDWVDHLRG